MNVRTILSAAVAAVSLSAAVASAQIRVGSDGRAHDANNQVGSFGINGGSRSPLTEQYLGNALITGNVTGFKYFRGGVPYADQNSFRGGMPSANFDSFIARSSGVPQGGQAAPLLPGVDNTQRFYGRDTVTPPADFQQQAGTGVYLQRPDLAQRERQERIDHRVRTELIESGALREINPLDVVMPGPVDPLTNLPTMLTASPLLGVRTWRPQNVNDQNFLLNHSELRIENALGRLRLDGATLDRMRGEIDDSVDDARQRQQRQDDGNLSRPVPQPFDAPPNGPLQTKPLDAQLNADPLGNTIRPEGGFERRLPAAPSVQSTQYAELENRLNRYYQDRLKTDEQKHREYLQQLKARQPQAEPKKNTEDTPGPATPPTNVGLRPNPRAIVPDYAKIGRELTRPDPKLTPAEAANIKRPDPVKITSLAQGVKAEGLATLLRDAEVLMKDGKYTTALDKYEAAQEVAPNNAMILVGRANAELGAGYYKKAENNLRIAMQSDPVVTMAQFDLKGMLGEQRLATIVGDLKATATAQRTDPGLVLLLAYLAYNSGAEAQAATYLTEADRRAAGKDQLVNLLRTHWNLPEAR